MSFPRYGAYKNSGVEWLGEVPRHWPLTKVKRIARFAGGGTPDRENTAFWNGDIPWVSPKDMKAELILDSEEHLTDKGLDSSAASLIASNTVLMVVRSGILKHTIPVAINMVPVALNQDMKALGFHPSECLSQFFMRWVQGLNNELLLAWSKQGATVESIETAYLAETLIALPPHTEQCTIAAFLDRETAKIDALVEEQQRLIALLKEKRQAVISHAVTKGLDPNAPMKDSGVEWLGEVPAHWEVCAIKRMCNTITDGAHISPETENGVFCFVSTKDLIGQQIDLEGCLRTSEASYEYLVRTGCKPEIGDVLFSKDGTIGRTVVVRANRNFVVASSLIIIRPNQEILNPDYFHQLCQSACVAEQVNAFVKGAGLPRLSIQNLVRVLGVFPPAEEQADIAAYLNRETGKIDTLIAEAEFATTLLQERRSALISAAVTGKIDVRGLAPSQAEAA